MAYNTIKLTKYSDVEIERNANTTITPGMLLELMSTDKVKPHALSGGDVTPVMFALEDELQGNGIDDNYSANNPVKIWIPGRGDVVYAILADNNDIDIGDKLMSKGDGTLEEYTAGDSNNYGYEQGVIAIALEAVDTTGSPAATTSRIKVMVI